MDKHIRRSRKRVDDNDEDDDDGDYDAGDDGNHDGVLNIDSNEIMDDPTP